MIEAVGVLVLLWIGWELDRMIRAIRGVEVEMSTARWERGKRLSGRDD